MSEERRVYKIRRVIDEDTPWITSDDVLTIAEAAEVMGSTVQAVALMLDRGTLTTIVDPDAPARQGRRLVLREEVERYAAARAGQTASENPPEPS